MTKSKISKTEKPIESCNIVELIDRLVQLWKSYNAANAIALDKNLNMITRHISGKSAERLMNDKYVLIAQIDEVLEKHFAKV